MSYIIFVLYMEDIDRYEDMDTITIRREEIMTRVERLGFGPRLEGNGASTKIGHDICGTSILSEDLGIE